PPPKPTGFLGGLAGRGYWPTAGDLPHPQKTRLGSQGVLWSQPGMTRARVPDVPGKAYIYLDVSGSMAQVLPYLVGLLVPYVANKKAEVFQFSTTIKPLPFADLKRGQIQTTGGTNINCIMEHLLGDKNKVRRALLLTDGYTGYPSNEDIQLTRDHKISVHVVMPADNHTEEELQIIAKTMTILPSIYPGTRW
ncbi:MAG: vWA domain-containing protein, partial [Aggregatilineales bacterium]